MFTPAYTADLGPLPPPAPTNKDIPADASAFNVDALCDALLRKLLPSIRAIVEEVAARTADRVLQSAREAEGAGNGGAAPSVRQGVTQLGVMEPGRAVTVDWTFTNSGSEPWPAGIGLRFMGGAMGPPQGVAPSAPTSAPTPPGGRLTVQATMVAPLESGPCEAFWQLEAPGGAMVSGAATAPRVLSPPLHVQGAVAGGRGASSTSVGPCANVGACGGVPGGGGPRAEGCSGRHLVAVIAAPPVVRSVGTAQGMPHPGACTGGHQPTPTACAAPGVAMAHNEWRVNFEGLFGSDVGGRLRDDPDRERQRMSNLIYEHVRRNSLASGGDVVVFDAKLSRLFEPFLQPGTTTCRLGTDLLPLLSLAAKKYSQGG
mmetsp:Transcript_18651/g.51152  ORF Transcript_18651/g.51152 Transcript_18651/m.51152 type:complete len:372 (-) Transcript_18651:192-1307(-)